MRVLESDERSLPVYRESALAKPEDRIKMSIRVLRDHAADDGMVHLACKVMAHKLDSTLIKTMRDEGGIEVIINLLLRPCISSILMEQACRALANMTADADNRTAAVHGGGVESVIAVLKRADAADSLLERACLALVNMTADADNSMAAGRGGSVETVIAVLMKEEAADSLLKPACRVLANMTSEDADNRKAAGRGGGV